VKSGKNDLGDFNFGWMLAEAVWLIAGNSNQPRVEAGDLSGL
jgi:hypothetical protein